MYVAIVYQALQSTHCYVYLFISSSLFLNQPEMSCNTIKTTAIKTRLFQSTAEFINDSKHHREFVKRLFKGTHHQGDRLIGLNPS